MKAVKNWEEDVLSSLGPVVIRVYAQWCGVCKTYAPVFDAVARSLGDRYEFVRLDAEKFEDLCDDLDVMGLPTTLIVRGRHIIKRTEGFMTERELVKFLES